MAEFKPTEIFDVLGIKSDEIKSLEDFRVTFEKEFIRKNQVEQDKDISSKIFGKRIGSVESKVKSISKKHGVDFTADEIKDKQVEDLIELSFSKIIDNNNKIVDDLKKESTGSKDEVAKGWEEKYTKLESKYKDTEGLLQSTKNDFEGFKTQTATERKNDKLNIFKEQSLGKLKFKPNIKEVEKAGFLSIIDSKYDLDLDEQGSLFVKDKKGERLKSAKVVGTFKSVEEVLEEEALKAEVIQINPNANANGRPTAPMANGHQVNANPVPVNTNGQKYSSRFGVARQG